MTIETTATETAQDAAAQESAALVLQWLELKDVEDAGKKAGKNRKVTGEILLDVAGKDAEITVNRGGFRTYRVNVVERAGSVQAAKVLAALVDRGIIDAQTIDELRQEFTSDPVEVITLKSLKR